MDLVTVVAACAIGLRPELFVPLGRHGDCARAASAEMQMIAGTSRPSIDRWSPEIAAASRRFAIPEALLRAVMQAESDGVPTATSPAGAIGLMQLMPATWSMIRRRYRLGDDPYAPADNIMAGAAFLRELIDRYGAPDFLAAYNAGPARAEAWRTQGVPLPDETRRYVARLEAVAHAVQTVSSTRTGSTHTVNLQSLVQGSMARAFGLLPIVARAADVEGYRAPMHGELGSTHARMQTRSRPSRDVVAEPSTEPDGDIFVHLGGSAR